MKVQVFVITSILGIITTQAFAAVTVPAPADVSNEIHHKQPNSTRSTDLFTFSKANWFNAWLSCLSCGMRLASITSQEEQDAVEKLIKEHNMAGATFGIAGNDIATEGRFNWFTSGEIFRYTNWAPNQPDNSQNGNEHCVEVKGGQGWDHMWNDSVCTYVNYYFCEKSYECF